MQDYKPHGFGRKEDQYMGVGSEYFGQFQKGLRHGFGIQTR